MNDFISALNSPMGGAMAAIVLSAAVRALPQPPTDGNLFYRWVYNFSHALLANFDKVGRKCEH